jgi:hypothetical protein
MSKKDTLTLCKCMRKLCEYLYYDVTFSKFALYLLYKVGERLAVCEIGVAAGQSGSSPRPPRVEVL